MRCALSSGSASLGTRVTRAGSPSKASIGHARAGQRGVDRADAAPGRPEDERAVGEPQRAFLSARPPAV